MPTSTPSQIAFINPVESNEYNCLDDNQFKGSNIGFHGTKLSALSAILGSGIKSASALSIPGGLTSVSFTKTSSTAYEHARMKYPHEKRVVFVVDFNSIQTHTLFPEGDVCYVYDHNPKPCIVAYCIEP